MKCGQLEMLMEINETLDNVLLAKLANANEKGIWQNFTAVTSWEDGDTVETQEFENGKIKGLAQRIEMKELLDKILVGDSIIKFPIMADKFFVNHLMKSFLDSAKVNDRCKITGLDYVSGFISAIGVIPDSRNFSRPDWNAKDLGLAYMGVSEEKATKIKEEVLFVTMPKTTEKDFSSFTKDINAQVTRLDYDSRGMDILMNSFDALEGNTVVIDYTVLDTKGGNRFLADLIVEFMKVYNEHSVAVYILTRNGFELVYGCEKTDIIK